MVDELQKKAQETLDARAEDKPGDAKEGDKPKTDGLIDGANAAAKRLEEANKKKEELLNREQEFAAKQQLAGRANAGQAVVEKTKDEKDQEEADRRVKEFF